MKLHFYKDQIKDVCLDKHLTVDEIYLEVQKNCPKAWRSTIYRNVDEMVKTWELKKICWIWSKAYYEWTKEEHVHLVDEITGDIVDIPLDVIKINLPEWFKMSGSDIRIYWTFN